jgi:hypothetical protein
MEGPWARSGLGTDWNGLSKYDLTKFNPWFFSRVKEFADLADTHGRILYHNFYFQHAIQETRAHYVDFPWRPVNCLQATDLPDENPAANAFYDIAHPVRRDLHRRYIRHCLDVLKDNTNVIYGLDREYSGPLPFVQFVLDTIAEWQRENAKKVFIALEVPKAQVDALLADPVRRPLLSAIDFHNSSDRSDGSLFAIEGGLNLAPRSRVSFSPGFLRVRRALRVSTAVFRTPQSSRVRRTGDTPVAVFLTERRLPNRRGVVGKRGARKAPFRRPMLPEPTIGRCAQGVLSTMENIFHVPTRGWRRDDSRERRDEYPPCPGPMAPHSVGQKPRNRALSEALACVRRSHAYVSPLNT